MEKIEKTAEEIRLEAEQNIKNLAIETTKAEFEKMVKSFTEKLLIVPEGIEMLSL